MRGGQAKERARCGCRWHWNERPPLTLYFVDMGRLGNWLASNYKSRLAPIGVCLCGASWIWDGHP
jgi:hypothetical protein